MKKLLGVVAATIFLASIVLANYLTAHLGFVSVGFGQVATAGTFAAGAALIVRDATQDLLGRLGVIAVILLGAGLSLAISAPEIAVASALAVLFSELANYVIYTPLRNRSKYGDQRWSAAVVSAGFAGAIVDTAVFLGFAFGAAAIWPATPGQLIGKAWAMAAYLSLGWAVRRAVSGKSVQPSSS